MSSRFVLAQSCSQYILAGLMTISYDRSFKRAFSLDLYLISQKCQLIKVCCIKRLLMTLKQCNIQSTEERAGLVLWLRGWDLIHKTGPKIRKSIIMVVPDHSGLRSKQKVNLPIKGPILGGVVTDSRKRIFCAACMCVCVCAPGRPHVQTWKPLKMNRNQFPQPFLIPR